MFVIRNFGMLLSLFFLMIACSGDDDSGTSFGEDEWNEAVVGEANFKLDEAIEGEFSAPVILRWHENLPTQEIIIRDEEETFYIMFEGVDFNDPIPAEGSYELSGSNAGEFEMIMAAEFDLSYLSDANLIDFMQTELDREVARFGPVGADDISLEITQIDTSSLNAIFEGSTTIRNHGMQGWQQIELNFTEGVITP